MITKSVGARKLHGDDFMKVRTYRIHAAPVEIKP